MSDAGRPRLGICVFCASEQRIGPGHHELAAEVGTEIARRGHFLISGGGSVSSMGAVTRAARSGGAHTVGVIPELLSGKEVADTGADELLVTTDMCTRKVEMMRRSDAFLTLAGGLGTLDELLEVWTTRWLGMHGKPVVVLDPDGVFAPLRTFAERLCELGFVRPGALDVVTWATSLPEAFEAIEQAAGLPGQLTAQG
jgi:uncharacterized protein (TIGR00730 family)